MTRPGEGRYAHIEREQRWIASRLPADARHAAEIVDRYIDGTRLRLRRMERADGVVAYKLGQKIRRAPADPELVRITTMYLSGDEYAVMVALPARVVHKSRWYTTWHGHTMAIDRLHGRLDGLLLAEAELRPDDSPLPLPPFAVRDVTNDDRFSGGALAFASDAEVGALLRHAGSP
ncbi:MAG: hypothetical protein ACLFXM_15065 [Acidimicrobiia bacterium]